ncbi:MAG TPA: hypothetical protein VN253_07780 [Kofleriaceae bacterium]|nr:hypothetical protein [Kofleriaceae bacterium]
MTAPWLHQALAENEALTLHHPRSRAMVAAAVVNAIPRDLICAAIKETASAVLLRSRNIRDGAGDLALEIGRLATDAVLLMLQVDHVDGDATIAVPVDSLTCPVCAQPVAGQPAVRGSLG